MLLKFLMPLFFLSVGFFGQIDQAMAQYAGPPEWSDEFTSPDYAIIWADSPTGYPENWEMYGGWSSQAAIFGHFWPEAFTAWSGSRNGGELVSPRISSICTEGMVLQLRHLWEMEGEVVISVSLDDGLTWDIIPPESCISGCSPMGTFFSEPLGPVCNPLTLGFCAKERSRDLIVRLDGDLTRCRQSRGVRIKIQVRQDCVRSMRWCGYHLDSVAYSHGRQMAMRSGYQTDGRVTGSTVILSMRDLPLNIQEVRASRFIPTPGGGYREKPVGVSPVSKWEVGKSASVFVEDHLKEEPMPGSSLLYVLRAYDVLGRKRVETPLLVVK